MRGRLSGVAGGLKSPPEPDYDRRLPESYQVRYIEGSMMSYYYW